jgi:hypothetical protein
MVNVPEYCGPALFEEYPIVIPITQIPSSGSKGLPLTLACMTLGQLLWAAVTVDLSLN